LGQEHFFWKQFSRAVLCFQKVIQQVILTESGSGDEGKNEKEKIFHIEYVRLLQRYQEIMSMLCSNLGYFSIEYALMST
jgi:hypothetical protein